MNSFDPYLISKLISKSLADELSVEEKVQLEKWLQESPRNRKIFESYKDENALQTDLQFFNAIDMGEEWEAIVSKIEQQESKAEMDMARSGFMWFSRYRKISIAAMLILVGIAGFFMLLKRGPAPHVGEHVSASSASDVFPGKNRATLILSTGEAVDLSVKTGRIKEKDGIVISSNGSSLNYLTNAAGLGGDISNTLIVPKGGNYLLVLPDSTRVLLNSESELHFPVNFSGPIRRVHLKGEGYFEVAKNVNKPFLVEANGASVQVLGTSFNINAYEDAVKTALVEGSVKLTTGGKSEAKILKPGELGKISMGQIYVEKADLRKALAWKNGEFYFKKDRLADILKQVGSWYDVEIDIEKDMEDFRISGSLDRKAKLSEVLSMLTYLTKGNFELDQRKLVVRKQK